MIIARSPMRITLNGGSSDILSYSTRFGGFSITGAIDKYVYGQLNSSDNNVCLEYHANIPTSSGLGTSGAMNVVWLALISQIKMKRKERLPTESIFRALF